MKYPSTIVLSASATTSILLLPIAQPFTFLPPRAALSFSRNPARYVALEEFQDTDEEMELLAKATQEVVEVFEAPTSSADDDVAFEALHNLAKDTDDTIEAEAVESSVDDEAAIGLEDSVKESMEDAVEVASSKSSDNDEAAILEDLKKSMEAEELASKSAEDTVDDSVEDAIEEEADIMVASTSSDNDESTVEIVQTPTEEVESLARAEEESVDDVADAESLSNAAESEVAEPLMAKDTDGSSMEEMTGITDSANDEAAVEALHNSDHEEVVSLAKSLEGAVDTITATDVDGSELADKTMEAVGSMAAEVGDVVAASIEAVAGLVTSFLL